MFHCGGLGEPGGAAGVDVDHGVAVPGAFTLHHLSGLTGQEARQADRSLQLEQAAALAVQDPQQRVGQAGEL